MPRSSHRLRNLGRHLDLGHYFPVQVERNSYCYYFSVLNILLKILIFNNKKHKNIIACCSDIFVINFEYVHYTAHLFSRRAYILLSRHLLVSMRHMSIQDAIIEYPILILVWKHRKKCTSFSISLYFVLQKGVQCIACLKKLRNNFL